MSTSGRYDYEHTLRASTADKHWRVSHHQQLTESSISVNRKGRANVLACSTAPTAAAAAAKQGDHCHTWLRFTMRRWSFFPFLFFFCFVSCHSNWTDWRSQFDLVLFSTVCREGDTRVPTPMTLAMKCEKRIRFFRFDIQKLIFFHGSSYSHVLSENI